MNSQNLEAGRLLRPQSENAERHSATLKGKKVKLLLCLIKSHAIEDVWVGEGIVPRILNLGSRWR
jgi:hypothetical protein